MPEEWIKEEICKVVRTLHEERLITATGGNVSARPIGSNEFWITPSGLYKAELRPEDLVKVDLRGEVVEGALRPSVEVLMHAMIYDRRDDVNGVIHCHPPFIIALTACSAPIEPICVTAVRFLNVPIVRFEMPGSKALAELVAEASMNSDVVLLQNHGLVTMGPTLKEALNLAQSIEEVAKVVLAVRALGVKPIVIPDEYVKLLERYLLRRGFEGHH